MPFKLENKAQISKYLLNYSNRVEKALIYAMEFMVADLQNHAKLNAGYMDQTSNLKSSIGGVVLKNGRPVSFKGFQGQPEGAEKGNEFLDTIITGYTSGYVLILVAGMEYATYVENYRGKNVLKKSEMKLALDMPRMMETIKSKMK